MHFLVFLLCLLGMKFTEIRYSPTIKIDKGLNTIWLKFCSKIFYNSISSNLWNQGPKIVATTFLGPAALAIYDIISKIPLSMKGLVGLGNRVIMPVASELHETHESRSNELLFTLGLKLNLVLFLPFILSLFILTENILLLWVGQEYIEYAYLMKILLLVPVCSLFMSHGFSIFLGTNYRVELIPLFGFLILILSSIYWLSFVEQNGLSAVANGRFFGLGATVPFALIIFFKAFNVNYVDFVSRVFFIVLLGLLYSYIVNLEFILLQPVSIMALCVLFLALYFSYSCLIYFILLNTKERRLTQDFIIKSIQKFSMNER